MKREHSRRTTARLVGLAFALIGCFGFSSAAMTQQAELPPQIAALIPEAKKEGEATIFGITLNPSQVDGFSKAMSAFYGFPIKLNMFGALHVAKTVEVVEAVRNGVPSGMDVFWSTAENLETLVRGEALARVDWVKEIGIDASLRFGGYGVRAHDGMLTNVFYNTKLVKPDQAPKAYEDLLAPRWKGRIAIPRSPGPWVNLAYAIGEDKTAAFVAALVRDQQARLLPRYPDVTARVINGEFPLGIGVEAFTEMRRGAPVAHANLDMVVIAPWGFAITKDAKSPAVGRLWAYWGTTPDGQATLDRLRGISRISATGTDIAKFAAGKKVFAAPYEFMVQHSERLNKRYGEIMGVVR